MKTDAETFEEEDKKKREGAETRNEADSAAYGAERLLSENGDKMTAEEKGAITSAMEEVRRLLPGEDFDAIRSAKSKLEKAVQDFSTRLYSQASAQGDGGNDGGAAAPEGETVDAEFTDQGQA
jgi:molecular chaperone DnaK